MLSEGLVKTIISIGAVSIITTVLKYLLPPGGCKDSAGRALGLTMLACIAELLIALLK